MVAYRMEGILGSTKAIANFVPRQHHNEGGFGADLDTIQLQRDSTTGITLSNNVSEMVPSEAILLLQRRRLERTKTTADDENEIENENEDTVSTSSSSSSILRELFVAKFKVGRSKSTTLGSIGMGSVSPKQYHALSLVPLLYPRVPVDRS
mmetsp:Transcript_19526/g.19860  ORF Transcript_19526/g.19860 Transcript_19526/m.19860 type:complete len:151 (+) Transcript_19526:827-1279(+)